MAVVAVSAATARVAAAGSGRPRCSTRTFRRNHTPSQRRRPTSPRRFPEAILVSAAVRRCTAACRSQRTPTPPRAATSPHSPPRSTSLQTSSSPPPRTCSPRGSSGRRHRGRHSHSSKTTRQDYVGRPSRTPRAARAAAATAAEAEAEATGVGGTWALPASSRNTPTRVVSHLVRSG